MKIFPLIGICTLLSLVSVSEAQISRLEKRLNVSHKSKTSQNASTPKKSRRQQPKPKESEPAFVTLRGLYNEESITLPKWLLKEVGDLNAQLKERLSASDYLEILKGEKYLFGKYKTKNEYLKDVGHDELRNIDSLRSKLNAIIKNPNNDDIFPRPRFVKKENKGVLFRTRLRHSIGDILFSDEFYAIERTKGLSQGHSSLLSFWDMRTGLKEIQFACQSYHGGGILGRKIGTRSLYRIMGGVSELIAHDWSGRAPTCYLVNPQDEIFQSCGGYGTYNEIDNQGRNLFVFQESGSLYNISGSVPDLWIDQCIDDGNIPPKPWYLSMENAMEGFHRPISRDVLGAFWKESNTENGYKLSLNSLILHHYEDQAEENETEKQKVAELILKSMKPHPIEMHGDEQMDQIEAGKTGNGYTLFFRHSGYYDSGSYEFPFMMGLLTPDGETYFFPNTFFPNATPADRGHLKPYRECTVDAHIHKSAETAFRRLYPDLPYHVVKNNEGVRGNIPEQYLGTGGIPHLKVFDVTLLQDGKSAELLIGGEWQANVETMQVVRLNLDDYTYHVEKKWSYRPHALLPIWISEKKLFLKPESDYQYSVICAEEGQKEHKIADLFIESPQRYALVLPDGRYAGSQRCENILEFGDGKHVVGMKALAPWRNRPAEVLEAIGGNADDIAALRETTKRWLVKLGYDPENMPAEPSLEDFPVAEVELPELYSQERIARFKVKVKATACDIAKLEIRADGILLSQSWGESLPVEAGQEKEVIVEAPLANGQNWIEVKAIDNRGISGDATRFRTIYKGETPSDLYVVALGVSDYDDPGMKLQYAAKDARDIAQAFEQYGTGRKHTLVLTDKEVKDKSSLQQVRDFLSAATIDDRVVFYVAGHGVLDEELNYYYAPAGFDGERLAETGIPMDDLIGCLSGTNARHRLLLLDTCHSGELGEEGEEKMALAGIKLPQGVRAIQGRGMKVWKTSGVLNAAQKKRYIEEMFSYGDTERGINIIAGSAGAEFAWESDSWSNGVFTASIIKALRGEGAARDIDGDGFFSVEELQKKVANEVQKLTRGLQKPNVVSAEGSEDMILTEGVGYHILKKLVSQRDWSKVEDYIKQSPRTYDPGQSEMLVKESIEKEAPTRIIKLMLEHGTSSNRNYYHALGAFLNSNNDEYIQNRLEIVRCFKLAGKVVPVAPFWSYSPRNTGDEELINVLCNLGLKDFKDPFKYDRPISIFRTFLDNHIDPDDGIFSSPIKDLVSRYCQTPSYDYQSKEDLLQKMTLLLRYGADPNRGEALNLEDGNVLLGPILSGPASEELPLHQLCRNLPFKDALPAIKLLIEHGADIHRKDSKGKEPLDTWDPNYKTLVRLAEAAKAGKSLDSVTVTSSGKASASGEDRSDLDPMIARMKALRCKQATSALYQKRLLTLLPLIRNGADVDITLPETKGNTALHYACGIGSWSITQWLVKHGANVNAQTNRGKTPLDCVGDDNAKRIRELLISHGAKKSSELPSEGNSESGTNASVQDADELNRLGLDYQYGKHGKTKNYNEAARHFRLAAEQGHAGAQNNLGFCYHNGWGVPKDTTQAAMWYKRSADQGNAWGQSNYGTCLEFGWGVGKDLSSAIEMYRKAAAQGHASAKKHLKRNGIAM